jgi:hypothetical protein
MRVGALAALGLALAACAGPVGTTRVDPTVVQRDLARSAVSTGDPSWPTRNVLFERGLDRTTFVPSAVDNMSPRHHFIRALQTIPLSPSITAHSIIAVEGDGPVEGGDDGVALRRDAGRDPRGPGRSAGPVTHP